MVDVLALPASPGQGPLGPARRLDWRTPKAFFDKLDAEFGFVLDACATQSLRRGMPFYSIEIDGLMRSWAPGPVFLNPPYGKEIGAWLHKAAVEQAKGVLTVALVPARLDVAWWHDEVMPWASEVRAIRRRLNFDDGDSTAPFASVVVVYRPGETGPPCLTVQQ
jgi:phage N-6-adenine-methyltransferase